MSQPPSLDAQRACLRQFGVNAESADAFTGIDPENEDAEWPWAISDEISQSLAAYMVDGRKEEPWSLLAGFRDAAELAGQPIDLHPAEDLPEFTTATGEVWQWPGNSPTSATGFLADLARVLGHGVKGFELCMLDGRASSDLACVLLSADQQRQIEQLLGAEAMAELLRPVEGPAKFRRKRDT